MLAPALHGAFPRPKQEKLHQRIFPTQGSNPGLLHRRRMVFFFFFTTSATWEASLLDIQEGYRLSS